MSFGWSAGDIASAIALLVKVGKALKNSDGAASEYQDTVEFLKSLVKTLESVQARVGFDKLDNRSISYRANWSITDNYR
jgi:hypothetical protein